MHRPSTIGESVCPSHIHCFHIECNADTVCRNAEYWSGFWKIQGSRVVFTIPRRKKLGGPNSPAICCYCSRDIKDAVDYTIEHLIPRSRGGNNKSINKFPCCASCNNFKGSKSMEYFIQILTERLLKAGGREPVVEAQIRNAKRLLAYINEKGVALYASRELYEKAIKRSP